MKNLALLLFLLSSAGCVMSRPEFQPHCSPSPLVGKDVVILMSGSGDPGMVYNIVESNLLKNGVKVVDVSRGWWESRPRASYQYELQVEAYYTYDHARITLRLVYMGRVIKNITRNDYFGYGYEEPYRRRVFAARVEGAAVALLCPEIRSENLDERYALGQFPEPEFV